MIAARSLDQSRTQRRERRSCTFSAQLNHYYTYNPRVSPHQLVQLARDSFAQLPQLLTGTK